MRTIAAVVLAAVAAVALTGCAVAPAPPVNPAPPVTALTEAGSTGGAGGSAGADRAAEATRDFAGCPAGADAEPIEVDDVTYADLTGDGHDEALVVAVCQSLAGSSPARVFVYGGGGEAPHRLLLTVGEGDLLTSSEVRASGRTLTAASLALSDDDPRCCPDLAITETWTWTGDDFERTSRTVRDIG